MNKLMKLISMLFIMLLIISMSISVKAYTNDDVINYIRRAHTVNGRTMQLNKNESAKLEAYLRQNPVTNEQADEIIAKLEEARAKLESTGVNEMSKVSDSVKSEVIDLIKSAANIAGLDIQVDTVNDIVTVKSLKTGEVIISSVTYQRLFLNSDTNGKPVKPTKPIGSGETGQTTSPTTTTSGKLVYTGNDYTVIIKSVIAIVAVAIAIVTGKKVCKVRV